MLHWTYEILKNGLEMVILYIDLTGKLIYDIMAVIEIFIVNLLWHEMLPTSRLSKKDKGPVCQDENGSAIYIKFNQYPWNVHLILYKARIQNSLLQVS